ncbi:hypothetical protein [Planococcus sp. ISL-109]|uniref:hypothetical protein n=1 Tax=Planococcus sp. ISL-109 TaxID=2819166 RepID=UPI001BEC05AA|nr:hypothetical protein [Planococcus sp. ISL-109]MBT2581223.1 hypothetical protein [Planococcus sp. ISL-109]
MNSIFLNNDLLKVPAPKQYEVFEFQNEHGHIQHIFEKREISVQVNGETYYDLASPSGFGGPAIVRFNDDRKWDLIFDFTRAFEAYCLEHHIVSEQVEFHAPFGHPADFLECYEVEYERDSFGIDVTKPLDQIGKEDLSKLWNAIDSGVEYRVFEGKSAISYFQKFVHRTDKQMHSNVKQYIEFIDENAFDDYIVVELSFKNQVLAMSCSRVHEDAVYTHWSTAASKHQYFEADKLLKCALYLWAKENGLQKAWSPKEKKQSKMAIETLVAAVCTGRKIWNERIYQELCNLSNIDKRVDFFPAYRSVQ